MWNRRYTRDELKQIIKDFNSNKFQTIIELKNKGGNKKLIQKLQQKL